MRILILANSDIGLYKFRKELLEKMIADGHTVILALPLGEFQQHLLNMGCEYFNVEIERRGMNPFKDIKLIIKYSYIIKKSYPDVVLTYTIKPNIYGGIASQLFRVRYISSITGLGSAFSNGTAKRLLIQFLYKIGIKKAKCVIFQNTTNLNYFFEHKICKVKKILTAGSGINLRDHCYKEYPEDSLPVTFIFAGRVMKDKGIEEFCKAAKNVKKRYPDVSFKIVGDMEEDYAEILKELEKENIISYLGFQKEIDSLLEDSHALILPSYHEGVSNVLLEAASCGRPVLASNIAGCREAFEEGVTGVGFAPRDVDSLISSIERFLSFSYEEKKQMGIEGRKKMEREFDRNIVIAQYMSEITM